MVLQFTRLFLPLSRYPPFLTSPSPSPPPRTKVTKRECLLSVPMTEVTDGTTGTETETEVTTEVQLQKIHCLSVSSPPQKSDHILSQPEYTNLLVLRLDDRWWSKPGKPFFFILQQDKKQVKTEVKQCHA